MLGGGTLLRLKSLGPHLDSMDFECPPNCGWVKAEYLRDLGNRLTCFVLTHCFRNLLGTQASDSNRHIASAKQCQNSGLRGTVFVRQCLGRFTCLVPTT